jgi:hypothetical protein
VRMLSQFYDKTPDLVSEQELQDYFLQRKNVNHWSPKTEGPSNLAAGSAAAGGRARCAKSRTPFTRPSAVG